MRTQSSGRSRTVGIRNSWKVQSCWAAAIIQALRACTVLMTLFRAERGAKTADEAVQAMMDQFHSMDRAAEAGKHAVDSKMLRSALSKYQKGAFKNGSQADAREFLVLFVQRLVAWLDPFGDNSLLSFEYSNGTCADCTWQGAYEVSQKGFTIQTNIFEVACAIDLGTPFGEAVNASWEKCTSSDCHQYQPPTIFLLPRVLIVTFEEFQLNVGDNVSRSIIMALPQAVYKLVALVLYRRSHFITLVYTPGDALGAFEVGKPGAAKPSMYQLVDDDRVTDITSLASAQDRFCSEGWRPHAVVYEQVEEEECTMEKSFSATVQPPSLKKVDPDMERSETASPLTPRNAEGGVKWNTWLLNRTGSSSGETSPLAASGCSAPPSLRPKTAPASSGQAAALLPPKKIQRTPSLHANGEHAADGDSASMTPAGESVAALNGALSGKDSSACSAHSDCNPWPDSLFLLGSTTATDLEMVGSASISREKISSGTTSHADILSLGSNAEEEGEDVLYASDPGSRDRSCCLSPPLWADWLTEEQELALVLLQSQLEAEAGKQLHFTKTLSKDGWLPHEAAAAGYSLAGSEGSSIKVHHVPAGDSAATASSHKQAAQLEGSQTAQNSKQVADTLTTDPALPSTKVYGAWYPAADPAYHLSTGQFPTNAVGHSGNAAHFVPMPSSQRLALQDSASSVTGMRNSAQQKGTCFTMQNAGFLALGLADASVNFASQAPAAILRSVGIQSTSPEESKKDETSKPSRPVQWLGYAIKSAYTAAGAVFSVTDCIGLTKEPPAIDCC